jgi:adenosylhomocysteine nucleosidase
VPRAGFITGLKSEADSLIPFVDRSLIRIAGMRPQAAEDGARDLVGRGCEVLVSFGLAAGLTAAMKTGDVILATRVIAPDGMSYATTPLAGIAGGRSVPLAGSDLVIATPGDKIALNQRTGACAVDMESHRVAQVAHERGVRCVVVRVIADRLETAIPRAIFDAVDAEGRPQPGVVISALARRPWEILGVMSLAAQSRAAHRKLRDVAPLLLAALGG